VEVLSFWQWRHPMPFLSFSEKWSISDKKVAKSLAVSGIMLTFAVRVGADGKERLR